MDVQCKNCGEEYSLDETLAASTGTSVRCTKCSHVFKVYRPIDADQGPDQWQLRQVGGATSKFDRIDILQKWIAQGKANENDMLSRGSGPWKRLGDIAEMIPFFKERSSSLSNIPAEPVSVGYPRSEASAHNATLQHRIPPSVSSPPLAHPKGSTIGGMSPVIKAKASTLPPPPMRDTPDPQPEFAATQRLQRESRVATSPHATLKRDQMAPKAVPVPPSPQPQFSATSSTPGDKALEHTANIFQTPAPAPAPDRAEPDLSQVPAHSDSSWEEGDSPDVASPTWAEKTGNSFSEGAGLPRFDDDDDAMPVPNRKIGRWIVLFFLVALVCGAFYMVKFERPTVDRFLSKLIESSSQERYEKFFNRGRDHFLLDSDNSFRQAYREFQKVLGGDEKHAPTLAALAEMHSVWAQYIRDAELDARADKVDEAEVEKLHREFLEKLMEANHWAEQAISADPKLPQAHRAMADALRLSGKMKEAQKQIAMAQTDMPDPETQYVEILLDMENGVDPAVLAVRLGNVSKDKPLLRGIYRRARILAASQHGDDAQKALSQLFKLNSQHQYGRDLAARIKDSKAISMLLPTGAAEVDDTGTDTDTDTDTEQAPEVQAPTATSTSTVTTKKKNGGRDDGPAVSSGGAEGGSVDSLLTRAVRAQESGKTSLAVGLFEKALERSPNNIDALSGLAFCHLDRGATGKAISMFRRALGVNPNFGPALIGLAETFKNQGQKEQALKYYQKYLTAHPAGRQANLAKRNVANLEQEIKTKAKPAEIQPENKPAEIQPENKPADQPEKKPADQPENKPADEGAEPSPNPINE